MANKTVKPTTLVRLERSSTPTTEDIALWMSILRSTRSLSVNHFEHALQGYLQPKSVSSNPEMKVAFNELVADFKFNDIEIYRFLKVAVEAFFLSKVQPVDERGFSDADVAEVNRRLRLELEKSKLVALLSEYEVPLPHTLPYLAVIANRLSSRSLRAPSQIEYRSINVPESNVPESNVPESNVPESFDDVLRTRLTRPLFVELIWSYWHEEGMLVQSINAISQRFQNIRGNDRDPLANMEIDPLRPLGNVLWGYIQDEQQRLSVRRRAYEYDHHYGFTLQGKAVAGIRTADSRSKFLEAFHNLLYLTTSFYQQDDDTTVIADAFPLVNGLRDLHMILSEGAHNQFGDLPSTARQEMLLQQWILSRPQLREFLPSRASVAYPENWMPQVDAMKTLQGWTDTSVINFSRLATLGEPLLLSIRYGNWSDPGISNDQAANWARFWRQEIQGYIYAYRTVTGVDLTAELTENASNTDRYLPPSVHLIRQLEMQQRGALPGTRSPVIVQPLRTRNRLPR